MESFGIPDQDFEHYLTQFVDPLSPLLDSCVVAAIALPEDSSSQFPDG